jgi:tetratricopeptide (TPR) repeat protein
MISYMSKADRERTLEILNRLVKENPTYVGDIIINKAILLCDLERFPEAIECYDEVLKMHPDDSIACNCRCNALCNSKKYDEAIECYDEVLKMHPDDSIAWNRKKKCKEKKEEAHRQQGIEKEFNYKAIRERQKWYKHMKNRFGQVIF